MSIAMFNPFAPGDTLENSYVCRQIQEIIDYADARFRAILLHITNKPFETKKWVHILLQREYVIYPMITCICFFAFIKSLSARHMLLYRYRIGDRSNLGYPNRHPVLGRIIWIGTRNRTSIRDDSRLPRHTRRWQTS